MNASFFADKFAAGLPYERYVETGTDEQKRRWKQFHESIRITEAQRQLIGEFAREMKVLVLSGIWCGDCVQQCPLIEHIAGGNRSKIDLRFVDRDQHADLMERFRINAGNRVPVAIFLAEDFEFCSAFGDRSLTRYRALARRHLGAACPTGIAAADPDEVAHTLADCVAEFERIQLMLRLSARLRALHGG